MKLWPVIGEQLNITTDEVIELQRNLMQGNCNIRLNIFICGSHSRAASIRKLITVVIHLCNVCINSYIKYICVMCVLIAI